MAHFAKINLNNIVTEVVSVNNSIILENGIEIEQKGVDLLRTLYNDPNAVWKQTSYNANFRGKYASLGDTYDSEKNAFIPLKPFANPSFVWDEQKYMWVPPTPHPTDGPSYDWNEDTLAWVTSPVQTHPDYLNLGDPSKNQVFDPNFRP